MKILYIHQHFMTPDKSGATRSYWISRELIRRGHQVTMITSTTGRNPQPCRLHIDGIDVVYVKNSYSNYMSASRKVLSFVNFVRKAISAAKREKDVDLVYATSTPLTVGLIAMYLKRRYKWKYIFEVRDLWPEFPIQIGAVKNSLLIWLLRKLEKSIYERAEHVVALSPGMKDGIVETGVAESKVSVIPNMSKPDIYFPHEPDLNIANRFGIDLEKFNVLHFGAMGRANNLRYIIDAAKIMWDRGDRSVCFVMMGGGAMKPLLKKQVKECGIGNVLFLDYHPMAVVAEVLNLCDLTIVSFLNLPILQTNSPNKLFDSLSAGKPIVVNSSGWTKDIVEQGNCGFYVDPEKPEEMAMKILAIKDNSEQLKCWGENARRLSMEIYDKKILTAQVADIVERFACNHICS